MASDPHNSTPRHTTSRSDSADGTTDAAERGRAWVERIRSGDEAAFEAMFREYYAPLVRFAARYLGRECEAARDLVHDVLFNIWQQRAHWKVNGALGAYLYGATRNRCVDYLRRRLAEDRWQQRVASTGDDPDVLAIAGRIMPGADMLTETDEIDAAIARAVARLPARCRQAFILHWERGLTYTEIAAAMGTSPNTVKVQIGRALKALRLALAPFLTLLLSILTRLV